MQTGGCFHPPPGANGNAAASDSGRGGVSLMKTKAFRKQHDRMSGLCSTYLWAAA